MLSRQPERSERMMAKWTKKKNREKNKKKKKKNEKEGKKRETYRIDENIKGKKIWK